TATTADASNTGPIVITSTAHGLHTGDSVTITGVQGNTNANSTWNVTVIDADHFSLDTSGGNAPYTTGGIWSHVTVTRTEIAHNDDYYGNDSYLELHLDPGTYYVAVTSVGNTDFDPTIADTG